MKAIRIHKPGGLEAIKLEEIPAPTPTSHEVVIQLEASGVNYIDVYFRTGLYDAPLPLTLGLEGAGCIVELGGDVKDFKIGDRVAYTGILGAYAQRAAVPVNRLVKLPDKLSFKEGAAAMVQGITAQYLTTSTHPLKKGDICLIHAVAGGVGLLLCQVAKMKGATVIGTVSSEEKAKLAQSAGADYAIVYTKEDFVVEVKRLTRGQGVHVVYDGVGASTFLKSLDCLMPRGMMVLFGQTSGAVPPFDLSILNRKGSLYVTRPGINAYIAYREELLQRANEVFAWILNGQLKLCINHELPLEKAKEAHQLLEGRKSTGKILLIPS
jgi:NADPH2:quinone reductase